MSTHEKSLRNLYNLWLIASLTLVLTMIIVGGLTRLTDSGLSITKWELFKGLLPPFTQTQWEIYFNDYKKIPQFEFINPSMTLNEFKVIFYWEYFHRFLGRLIGIFFLIPLLYFHFSKGINNKKIIPCYIIFTLIVLQGVIGWYMVKSGLVNAVTVSHYRLSLHLTLAILISSMIFWQILNTKNNVNKNFLNFSPKQIPYIFLIFLIFLQIILGAFVSGLDAGKIYQTWPMMGNNYFPDDFFIKKITDFLNFDNHSLVQFYHRNIAYFIFFYIITLSFFIFKNNEKKLYKAAIFVNAILLIQVTIGILTLLSNLNIFMASIHQICGVILVLSTINLYYKSIN